MPRRGALRAALRNDDLCNELQTHNTSGAAAGAARQGEIRQAPRAQETASVGCFLPDLTRCADGSLARDPADLTFASRQGDIDEKWRRGGDSNPRQPFGPYPLSRRAP